MFRSANGGTNWTTINNGLAATEIASILVINDSTVYAGTNYYGIFKSTNNGNNWVASNNGLGNLSVNLVVNAIVQLPNNDLLIATAGGIFCSTNDGSTWTSANIGLTSSSFYGAYLSPTGKLYAGSTDKGIFLSSDNGNSWCRLSMVFKTLVSMHLSQARGALLLQDPSRPESIDCLRR